MGIPHAGSLSILEIGINFTMGKGVRYVILINSPNFYVTQIVIMSSCLPRIYHGLIMIQS